jgi:hypothetical protein
MEIRILYLRCVVLEYVYVYDAKRKMSCQFADVRMLKKSQTYFIVTHLALLR